MLLNKEGSDKETIHLEMCLAGSGLEYRPGDSLAIIPTNSTQVVEQVIEAGGFDAGETVELKDGATKPLNEAFASDLDINGVTKNILKKYNALAQSEKLESLLDPGTRRRWTTTFGGGRSSTCSPTSPCRGCRRRTFAARSGSSCRACTPSPRAPRRTRTRCTSPSPSCATTATTATVRVSAPPTPPTGSARGKPCRCTCTSAGPSSCPRTATRRSSWSGRGTGIAPFRAFVEERDAIGATGKSWLFFGDQHRATDYLYGDEWERYVGDGKLSRIDLAFSRDQEHKVYVQHRMLEHAAEMYSWLSDGAVFYVCGDASRMAKDVHEALITIGEQEGGKSREDAETWVKQLKADKQYLRDVY